VNDAARPLHNFRQRRGDVDDRDQPVNVARVQSGHWLLNEMWMMDMRTTASRVNQWQMEELLTHVSARPKKTGSWTYFAEKLDSTARFEFLKTWGFKRCRLPFNPPCWRMTRRPVNCAQMRFSGSTAPSTCHAAGIMSLWTCTARPGRARTNAPVAAARTNCGRRKTENARRFLWRMIADRYKNSPTVAGYDLLNEPYGDYRTEPPDVTIVSTMDKLIHAIREVDGEDLIFALKPAGVTMMYGPPASRGWSNVGYTKHFYPGLFGACPRSKPCRFLSRDLQAKGSCSSNGKRHFLAGEFNVSWIGPGVRPMMRVTTTSTPRKDGSNDCGRTSW